MEILVSDVELEPLLIVSLWTAFVCFLTIRKLKDKRSQIMFFLLCVSVFIYSGYGISYPEVNNKYIISYMLFLSCFALPFYVKGPGLKRESLQRKSDLDFFLERHRQFLKFCAYSYLLCLLIPLLYPEFRLFKVFQNGFEGLIGFYDLRVQYKSNAIIGLVDTLRVFLCPLFFIYLTIVQNINPRTKKPIVFFLISVFFAYARYSYMGRYQMVINAILIYFILSCVRGYTFKIKFKNLVYIAIGGMAAIPLLYAFIFIRQGNSVEDGGGFFNIAKMLIDSEAYYPIYYDHILNSSFLKSQTPLTFILWLIFLPIPSVIWPSKPTLQSDAFTYSLTGMHYGDANYSSSLPSVLGESFMYFGEQFYWVQALIMGFIVVFSIKYLLRHKCTNLLSLYLIVYVMSVGRGGAASYMSTIVFGVLPVFFLDKFIRKPKKI